MSFVKVTQKIFSNIFLNKISGLGSRVSETDGDEHSLLDRASSEWSSSVARQGSDAGHKEFHLPVKNISNFTIFSRWVLLLSDAAP